MSLRLPVAVDTPRHAGLAPTLDYLSEQTLAPGTLVRVPLGRREVTGVVWLPAPGRPPPDDATLRPLSHALDELPPLNARWLELASFAAGYYQRALGELALSVLPPELRKIDAAQLAQRLRRLHKRLRDVPDASEAPALPPLTEEQSAALAAVEAGITDGASHGPALLLHGVTGSGKTEVYLRAAALALERSRQVLMLVPEINLTPQLLARVSARFPARRVVAMHSGLTAAQRLQTWLLAHLGHADIVLGTRLAVFASLPRLGLVVVDEEHDASYKQQEGARYSARDLAVYRARLERVPVLLGSATPSLETWQRVLAGRYRRLALEHRIGGAALPHVRIVDLASVPREGHTLPVLAPALLQALRERLARGEQSLLFLNRRGYAPVLHCADCGWKSACAHCSAWRVFHKHDRTLRCHHCGHTERVPRACPECGNLDIAAVGRGTERLEEQIGVLLPGARVARFDADSTRGKGQLERTLAAVHAGEVDVLVGTQMVTKGHDFRRITLVAAVNPDAALFASDFRAPERQFALLMQAAGRAGRDAASASASEMWIQTWHPRHPLFAALRAHDYASFAAKELEDRRRAGLPPFAHLALLRAEAREAAVAGEFLVAAARAAATLASSDGVKVYPPVPPAVARVAGIERLQMLVESASRTRLQRFLTDWLPLLHARRGEHKRLARWAVDVDPQAI